MIPQARHDNLVVQEVGDELVVYDKERYRTHRLNRTAALVWRHCDGQTSVAELAKLLQRGLKVTADDGLVWLSLQRLEKAHLLQGKIARPKSAAKMSRRQVLRRLGLTAAAALAPVVTSLGTPSTGRAQFPPSPYCHYKILQVLRPCNITPAPVAGDIVCTECFPRGCPTLPRGNCHIRVTVLGRVVRCHVRLQRAPVKALCDPCPAANSILAGITCE